ncbi:helicase SNF2 [Variovorax sp. J22P240]|uniref:helicase SNF2 n=1 Tax=Variovorax sp. J22P240 TaxID=3053514 RepID=UPI00257777F2|nr:helicase SNF2 [Variovorax sp. J22P240]MDM0001882.1 helicase SNF2 [Variovorax sp. J22P240]
MNTASKLLSGFALAILAAAGVQAETYDGVTKVTSTQSRAAVRAEGVVAAHSGDRFSDAAGQGVVKMASSVDRASVRSQGFAAAHGANPYAEGYGQGVARVESSVDRASVRLQARAAARGDRLPI